MSTPALVPSIVPESLRMNSVFNSSGVLVEHVRALGSDGVVYEWDWNTGSWKSWKAGA